MLVSIHDLTVIKNIISKQEYISLDTETTGLDPYGEDVLFGISISTKDQDFYFNFYGLSDCNNAIPLPHYVLSRDLIAELLNSYTGCIFMHNAKFDLAFLQKEGVAIDKLNVICTQAGSRIEYNDRMSYSLDNLGKELGYEKLDTVKKFINKNKLYSWKTTKGKKKRVKIPYYQIVPLSIISEYAEMDSKITYALGKKILNNLSKEEHEVLKMEQKVQLMVLKMEKKGILVDIEYCKKGLDFYQKEYTKCMEEFQELTGFEFIDSNKHLSEVFTSRGEKYPTTEKGNPSFNDKALKDMNSPIAKIVQKYRSCYKKANTYFNNFIELSGNSGIVHCNFRPSGTATGRFSCSNPNLQNLNKEDK